jgi:hypothetical protein
MIKKTSNKQINPSGLLIIELVLIIFYYLFHNL